MHRPLSRGLSIVALVVLFCAAPAPAAVELPVGFVNEVLVDGLEDPTSMAFLPDGRVLITEQRTGKIRLVVDGHIAATDPVHTVENLSSGAYERGLLGIAVDPEWPDRPFVYVHYTRIDGLIRVARYRASGDLTDPLGENLTLGDRMLVLDNLPDNQPSHNGGCVRFGPDRHLYVSLGEDGDSCAAADSTRMKGVILRLRVRDLPETGAGPPPRDSLIPADNPLVSTDANARLVWAYGLRNPWRFQIDPPTGLVYAGDVGEDRVEEIDEVHAGDFLGWPWREGNYVYPRVDCPEPGGEGSIAYRPPVLVMAHLPDNTAIVSAGRYRPVSGAPANWPLEYFGNLFYTEYYTGVMRRHAQGFDWPIARPVAGQPDDTTWGKGFVTAVDFLVGPDGSLWWLRQFDDDFTPGTGSLQRIRYVPPAVSVRTGPDRGGLRAIPNPFARATELSFAFTTAGYARLEVFDLSGRLVRRLLDAGVLAGERRFTWDGRDAEGRVARAGVYFARLERPERVESLRLLRLE